MISSQDLQILSSTHLFSGFSEEALRALCAALRPSVAELPRGRVLWRMGEQVTQAGIVLSGRVEAWHYSASGHADLAAVHEAGGVFGDVLMSAQTVGSPVELRTAADSRIFFLSLVSLLALCAAGGGEDCAHLLENLLREVSEKYWRLQRRIQRLSIPDGRRRLADFLCAQGAADFTLPISREQMARQLGMDRSALSRLLGRLRDEGLLRWDRSHFVLLDPAALRSLVDDA
mgnify:CR=1 FL=1